MSTESVENLKAESEKSLIFEDTEKTLLEDDILDTQGKTFFK